MNTSKAMLCYTGISLAFPTQLQNSNLKNKNKNIYPDFTHPETTMYKKTKVQQSLKGPHPLPSDFKKERSFERRGKAFL